MGVQRTVLLRGLLLALLLLSFAAPVSAATTIGLYTDGNGSSCSFSGNQSGTVFAYVIVKPDALGLSGVRFSAPVPACFGGTWVADHKPDETLTISESPIGISVAFTSCATTPRLALTIEYVRTSTTPCCAFPIEPDPFVGIIEGTTCALDQASVVPIVSHFNANATCPCSDPTPPHPAENPSPANNALLVPPSTGFSWSPSPLDGDVVSYDIYYGVTSPPPFVANVTSPAYQPAQTLLEDAVYYWKVVVRDADGYVSPSPTWTFRTRLGNYPPNAPNNPTPANNATNVNISTTLLWSADDTDNEEVTFDLYFGTTSPPPLVATDLANSLYPVNSLQYVTTYYWRAVARDPHGATTSGPEWHFTTRSISNPPAAPSSPVPALNATGIAVNAALGWQCTDPDGDAMTYDVYFGIDSPPALVAQNVGTKSFQPPLMGFVTKYFWKIVARDVAGLTTAGPTWSFTTRTNTPPTTPANPAPANNATGIWVNPTLMWTSSDEYPGLRFDVYFGTANPPPLVASNFTGTSYSLPALQPSTTYHWKIVARDVQGLTSTGSVWTFFTATFPVPFGPTPSSAGFGADPLTLSWSCSTPNGQAAQCDVYFGTTNPPPLVASGVGPYMGNAVFQYTPTVDVVPGTTYYWRIFAADSFLGGNGPLWSFTGGLRGDVTGDGLITTDDAACALKIAVGNVSCSGSGRAAMGDVDCSTGVTARDALCIHRRAIGETCPFCGDSETSGTTQSPIVTRSSYSLVGNVVTATLAVLGVPALEAFTFHLRLPTNVVLTSATRIGATQSFTALEQNQVTTAADVAGYSLIPGNATFNTDFIQLQFQVTGALSGFIVAEGFGDDLFGASPVTIVAGNGKGGGGATPVTFSRFDAKVDDGGVRIAWLLRSTSVTERYTIYRHDEGSEPRPIATGDIREAGGSYLDRTVEVGRTYRYEMLVHTEEGDDVRSQLVTVTVASLGLALGPNHPNPFNPLTTIPYYVPAGVGPVRVRLVVYDTSGRVVRVLVNEDQSGGPREVVWRGDDQGGSTVSSGIYFCVLQVGNEQRTQKLVMLK